MSFSVVLRSGTGMSAFFCSSCALTISVRAEPMSAVAMPKRSKMRLILLASSARTNTSVWPSFAVLSFKTQYRMPYFFASRQNFSRSLSPMAKTLSSFPLRSILLSRVFPRVFFWSFSTA